MYTDSRVVLGYINNEHRRFYVYVGNRVDIIRHSTTADQWNYVSSEDNPADIGTRSIPAGEIGHSAWLQGPSILKKGRSEELREAPYELVDPDEDREVRPLVISSKKTSPEQHTSFGVHRFERFSTWWSLLRAIARIKHLAMSFQKFQKTSETFVSPVTPSVLTPNILLTQKMDSSMLPKALPDMDLKEAYRSQWKHVVVLSQEFWKKWRMQYLSNLQNKRKWTKTEVNLTEGDIVLLKNSEVTRDQWPMAVVERVFPSADNRVRTVQIRVAKDRKSFIRPICELIPLMRE